MVTVIRVAVLFFGVIMLASPCWCADEQPAPADGSIITFWPLFDYRESPREGFSNLGLLGPLIKLQQRKDEQVSAVRPLFYRTTTEKPETAATDYVYPLVSTETSAETSRFQLLKLVQKNSFRKDEPGDKENDAMFFPFYISGSSKKYGPYRSIFPFYGDIYERFWRDEYHFVLFPLYGSTVKKGTTSRNYLYPFFNTLSGEKESGFHFWPLYGQASKEGVYRRKFALWPFFMKETTGMDTDNPTEKFILLPYAATDSPKKTSRSYFWPFVGYSENRERKETERDYFWPFWWTLRGEDRRVDSYLPFYSNDVSKKWSKNWIMWPFYRHDSITSETFVQERDRILYFLYSDNRESWPKDGAEKRRTELWPLFVYKRDLRSVKSFSFPALVEPILDREGIENNWAPLWRVYQQKWNDAGDSAASFFWNLYWHESRGDSLAYELFPLVFYIGESQLTDMSLLKGLFRYRSDRLGKELRLFWLPFGIRWGEPHPAAAAAGVVTEAGGGVN